MVRFNSALQSPRTVAAALLAVGGLITYLVNFPGSMEFDSFVQLVEARAESYSNWHPAVMSWLLGVSDALPGPPAAWIVGFDMILAFGSLIAVLWLAKGQSWAAVAAAAVTLVLPQFFLLQAIVWKDTLLADAVLTGFVLIGLAAKHWRRPRLRFALLAGSVMVLALAILTRQNGIVVLPFAAAGLGIIAIRFEGKWRGARYGVGLLVANDEMQVPGLTIGIGAKALAASIKDTPGRTNASAIALGAQVRYELPSERRVAFAGEGYFAPKIITFGDADRYQQYGARAEFSISPQLQVYAGYRKTWFSVKGSGADSVLINGPHVGVQLSF